MQELVITNLHANVEGKEILKGVNLTIKSGEVHAIMGPNGTGKSTLSAIIMGHPKYTVTEGSIKLNGQEVLGMEVDERAKAGLFLGMQYPSEIAGITNSDFIRAAINSTSETKESLIKYIRRLDSAITDLKMDSDMTSRYLNEGFSGGEKKRNEILQLKMLKPKFAILDEIDSGLDIDALTVVGQNLTKEMEERSGEFGMLLITHYQRLLDHIKPTHVHVMLDGRIVKTGGSEIVERLEVEGYDRYKEEHGIEDVKEKRVSIGNCATSLGVNGNGSNN
ncbi:Fe-S cluster assembly ATPase SufC [Mollicutes bacterium LVI A0078]|nr:Fe-S cluster assembly ATPase SufC [Mollicutes bacterium LVI A0075]WOO90684.1 Fe-S cluster assembly ATPase SufC [Mollicutes bacterium LVI A0078]